MSGASEPGVRARLLRVFSAQIYNQGVTMLVQIGLVPVLLALWGVKTYGTWLLVSAVPTYLAFSDLGFTYVAKNVMVSQVANGDRAAALRTFQSIFALLNIVAPLALLVLALVAWGLDVPRLIGVAPEDAAAGMQALVLLVAAVLVYQYFLLVCAGVRSENRAAIESVFGATIRLVEAVAIAAVAASGAGIVAAAAATLIARLLYTGAVYLWLRGASPWLSFGHEAADRAEIRAMLHPAIAYAVIPIAQALLIQGPVIVVGSLMGPAAVVVFSTTRTLTRMGTSATNVLNNTFVTEYAYRWGSGAAGDFLALMRRHQKLSVAAIGGYAVGLMLFGRLALGLITHGTVDPGYLFLALMMAGVACEMLYSSILTPLSAANRHTRASHFLLAASIAGVLACYPAVKIAGLSGGAAAVFMAQAIALAGFLAMLRALLRQPPLSTAN